MLRTLKSTAAMSQFEAPETTTTGSVGRQPQYFVIQFAVLLVMFALLLVYSRQHRRAALKGNVTASKKIVLPSLEPLLSILSFVSLLFTVGFTVVLVEQTSTTKVSAIANEIAYSGKQFVIVVVLSHVTQRRFTIDTPRSSALLALVVSCYTIPVAWCLNSASEPFPSSRAYLWALSASRGLLLFFYIKIVIRPPSSRASPSSTREYCAFAATSHVLSFAIDVISHSGRDSSADALAYANLVLTSLSPLFIWRVLRADTEHWRVAAIRTCELHNQLLLELKTHTIHISCVHFPQERISPQGLHLRIEMQPKLILDFGSLDIKQRLASINKSKQNSAIVFSGVLHSRTAVAVKVYTPLDFADEMLARFAHEAALCGALHHPNIVRFYGMCVSPPSVSFATELCTATLADVLHGMAEDLVSYTQPTKYHFLVQLGYILDATRAVAYLHSFSPAFVHRELCPTTFVVDQDGNVKLTGLGEAKNLQRTQQCRVNSDLSLLESGFSLLKSPRSAAAMVPPPLVFDPSESSNVEYIPPEVLPGNLAGDSHYEEAVDVFALAMIMWDVLHPDCERFSDLRSSDTVAIAQAVSGGFRPKIAACVHPYLRQLIESSWDQDARLRPSTQYIVSVLETIQEEVMNDLAGELFHDLGGQFYGEEAVLHLIRSRRVSGKPQAIRLGNALMDTGVLHHVNHSKGFEVCKYGVYYIDESSLNQQRQHSDTHARLTADGGSHVPVPAEDSWSGVTDQDRSTGDTSVIITPATQQLKRPRQLTIDSNDSFVSISPHATKKVHRVESFQPDQLRLIDSTLCACRRLGQRMEEPAKLVRRTRRPTPRLLEEENSLTADLLSDVHASNSL